MKCKVSTKKGTIINGPYLDERRECKKYTLSLSSFEAAIDLLPELDVNPLPNLGPKVNHHFKFNNSAYIETEHPRWGYIQSVTPLRYSPWMPETIKAGKELFTYYGYKKAMFPEDFPWYWEDQNKILREERLKKEAKKKSMKDNKQQKIRDRKKAKNCPKD